MWGLAAGTDKERAVPNQFACKKCIEDRPFAIAKARDNLTRLYARAKGGSMREWGWHCERHGLLRDGDVKPH